jgi:hypothetical protein
MDKSELIVKSEDGADQVSKTKTIYDVGAFEIFWRNFLAGLSRSLGGILVYLTLLIIFGGVFFNIILPKFMPVINTYMNVFKSLETISNAKPGSVTIPENIDLQKLFGR